MKMAAWVKQHRWLIGLLLALVLGAVLLRGLVQIYLAEAAAQALWQLRLFSLRVPQSGLWLGLIMLAFILFAASLVRPLRDQPWQWDSFVLSADRPLKRLVHWIERSGSAYARRRLCQTVTELALSVLATRLDISPHQVKTEILQDHLPLPPEVASYLRDGLRQKSSSLEPGLAMLPDAEPRIDPRLVATLEFLELEASQ